MRYIGIDLHKRVLVVAIEGGSGRPSAPRTFCCRDVDALCTFFEAQRPFRAVIEASSSYRSLYEVLAPLGEVVLAHPLRLRAIAAGSTGPAG
jgi:transposase